MARERKRACRDPQADSSKAKRPRLAGFEEAINNPVAVGILPQYYSQVQSLGKYLLQHAPSVSRLRDRIQKLAADDEVVLLLKTTLVGSFRADKLADHKILVRDFQDFTQGSLSGKGTFRHESGATASSLGYGMALWHDIVDFAIWRTFNKTYRHAKRPPHVLCNGYMLTETSKNATEMHNAAHGIEGLSCQYINGQTRQIKGLPWARTLQLLGKGGDFTMLSLLLDCGIYIPVKAGQDNYLQLSGTNITELPLHKSVTKAPNPGSVRDLRNAASLSVQPRPPSQITFIRSRMFYGRATLNGKGEVHFGLRHIHVLNRCKDDTDTAQVIRVMQYIFPRQFGLHNVFTSSVDKRETSHTFKDYTLREQEIATSFSRRLEGSLPKRLRGNCVQLVQKLQRLHRHCAYKELLKHYCHSPQIDQPKRRRKRKSDVTTGSSRERPSTNSCSERLREHTRDLVDLATPISHVAAFVRAVILRVLPLNFLGQGAEGVSNVRQLLSAVDQFVACKRFENMNLESVLRGIKISHIDWLIPLTCAKGAPMALTEFNKRKELIAELCYYIFDSIVIPLLRANFYITDSNDHRYRLFYFRHDVWKFVTEPLLTNIRGNMYQEVPFEKARKILASRSLGHSQVRLLPKRATARPITNLRKRHVVTRNGRSYLGPSINSLLKNVSSMLHYERDSQPGRLGSAISSVDELNERLMSFKRRLAANGLSSNQLYFVKTDVQACFDTIPQDALLELVEELCQQDTIEIQHHALVKAPPGLSIHDCRIRNRQRPSKKFKAIAHANESSQRTDFTDLVQSRYASGKRNTIFAEGGHRTSLETEKLLDLLDEHVRRNFVRIGKKFYRQKMGIPQGSVVSTLLCNFFYGDFEQKQLHFLHDCSNSRQSFLVRLIDDFFLITTDRDDANRFLHVMLAGNPDYGITVKAEKTMVNFDPASQVPKGLSVTVSNRDKRFPWCGTAIDQQTLAIFRDHDRTGVSSVLSSGKSIPNIDLANSTTVEAVKQPGIAFYRKMMASLRLKVSPMYTNTNVASIEEVKLELSTTLTEVAHRALRYLASLRTMARKPRTVKISNKTCKSNNGVTDKVFTQAIRDVAVLTLALTRKDMRVICGTRSGKNFSVMPTDYHCSIGRRDIELLTADAFISVLQPHQTRYRTTLRWLRVWRGTLCASRAPEM